MKLRKIRHFVKCHSRFWFRNGLTRICFKLSRWRLSTCNTNISGSLIDLSFLLTFGVHQVKQMPRRPRIAKRAMVGFELYAVNFA